MLEFLSKIRFLTRKTTLGTAGSALILLYLSGTFVFCLFYLLSSYEALKHWYLSLNGCFLTNELWASNYFTERVKSEGNVFVIIAMIISVFGILYTLRRRKGNKEAIVKKEQAPLAVIWWYVCVACTALALGIREWQMIAPTYDEALSSEYSTTMPTFQILSYFLSTNNHIFFNVANHLLFGWYGDKLESGRLLSLLAYTGTMLVIFRYLAQLAGNRFYTIIMLFPIALQFSTLGFAVLSRGYEWQLFSGWMATLSLLSYLKDRNTGSLRTNVIFNILGMILIPSYIYFYLSQVLFMVAVMCFNARAEINFWKHQLICVAMIFLFYLPAFCFSGFSSIASNKSATSHTTDALSFLPGLVSTFKYLINYCFTFLFGEGNPINYVLFFLPLVLFFSKRKQEKTIGLFYLAMWLEYIAWGLIMRYSPYERMMIVQLSITMACTTYALYFLVDSMIKNIAIPKFALPMRILLFVVPVIFFTNYLFKYHKGNYTFQIYGYNVNGTYNRCIDQMHLIPNDGTIAFSEHSFYLCYVYRRFGYKVTQCTKGHEDYYVLRSDEGEPMPADKQGEYVLFTKGIDEYDVYKRK